jgi:hypothetical protein
MQRTTRTNHLGPHKGVRACVRADLQREARIVLLQLRLFPRERQMLLHRTAPHRSARSNQNKDK